MSEYTITVENNPDPEEVRSINAALSDFNHRHLQYEGQSGKLTLMVRDPDGKVVGGLWGDYYWGWLYVDTLALRDEVRLQGVGSRLLALADREALARGCHGIYLDTMSFQALPFYEKNGYTVFGTLDHFPAEHKRYFLKKELKSV